MARTKQKKAGKRQSTGCDQVIRDFNRLMQLSVHKAELDFKNLEQKFNTNLQCGLNRFPTEIQNMTLRNLLTIEASPVKENLAPKTPRVPKTAKKASMKPQKGTNPKRTTAASDDGYQSESAASQASKLTATKTERPSRSTSRDQTKERARSISRDRKSKLSTTSMMSKKDVLKTPLNKQTMNSFVITPKIRMNSAMNVLRKAKQGEMVFSTQGSPLMVSTTVSEKTANINVPLRNGDVLSLLPFNETSLTDNLYLDEETKHQLKILQSHLSKVLD